MSHILRLLRFRLIETAEESDVWLTRVRKQWESNYPLAARVVCGGATLGTTPPKMLQTAPFVGLSWEHDTAAGTSFPVPLSEEPNLVVEVVGLSKAPAKVLGMCTWTGPRNSPLPHHTRTTLHVFPISSLWANESVFAVIDVEITAVGVEPPSQRHTDTPLDYPVGMVRASALDLYFPDFLLNAEGGQVVVSNVVCVANMSEHTNLSMRMIAKGDTSALVFHPAGGVIVHPNQRAFFSITWNTAMTVRPNAVDEVQLLLSGQACSPPPVVFRIHTTYPKGDALTAAYHYWVNTACISNRPVSIDRELPFIHSVLPIFMLYRRQQEQERNFLTGLLGSAEQAAQQQHPPRPHHSDPNNNNNSPNGGTSSANGSFTEINNGSVDSQGGSFGGSSVILVKDKDTGFQRPVAVRTGVAGPVLIPPDPSSRGLSAASQTMYLQGGSIVRVVNPVSPTTAAASLAGRRSRRAEPTICTLQLGTLKGFPMVSSSAARDGIAPTFRITATCLSDRWELLRAVETAEVYQTLSGSLRWAESFTLRKGRYAPLAQFLRLTLMEVSPLDGDETPIAAATISLSSDVASALQPLPVLIAFYVYDTFSMYDALASSSLVMAGSLMWFSDEVVPPPKRSVDGYPPPPPTVPLPQAEKAAILAESSMVVPPDNSADDTPPIQARPAHADAETVTASNTTNGVAEECQIIASFSDTPAAAASTTVVDGLVAPPTPPTPSRSSRSRDKNNNNDDDTNDDDDGGDSPADTGASPPLPSEPTAVMVAPTEIDTDVSAATHDVNMSSRKEEDLDERDEEKEHETQEEDHGDEGALRLQVSEEARDNEVEPNGSVEVEKETSADVVARDRDEDDCAMDGHAEE